MNGLLGDALAAVEEARLHGFSPGAAFVAAADHLELADRNEAILIASLLASWIACDLNPTTHVTDLAGWLGDATALVARRGAS
jgi:hypothetical protein